MRYSGSPLTRKHIVVEQKEYIDLLLASTGECSSGGPLPTEYAGLGDIVLNRCGHADVWVNTAGRGFKD